MIVRLANKYRSTNEILLPVTEALLAATVWLTPSAKTMARPASKCQSMWLKKNKRCITLGVESSARDTYQCKNQGPGLSVVNRTVALSVVSLPMLTVSRRTGLTSIICVSKGHVHTMRISYSCMWSCWRYEQRRKYDHANGKDAIKNAFRSTNAFVATSSFIRTGPPTTPPGMLNSMTLLLGSE
jgi:hypothetical protein